jgi:subfamily B ATP-binding cassette protein MsbA
MLLSMLYSGTQAGGLGLIKGGLEQAIEKRHLAGLLLIGGMLVGLAAARAAFGYGQAYMSSFISNTVTRTAQNQVMKHLLHLPLSFYHRQRTGEITTRMGRDAGALRRTVKLATSAIKEPITLLSLIAYVFWMNWELALVGSIGFFIAIWPLQVLSRKMRRASRKGRQKAADIGSHTLQCIGGIRLVKAYGQEEAEHQRFVRTNKGIFRQAMKAARARATSRAVVEVLSTLGLAAAVVVGGYSVMTDFLTVAELGTFLVALVMMYGPAKALAKSNEQIQDVIPGAERFFELLDAPNTMTDAPNAVEAPRTFREIEVKNVTYSYLPDTPVLRDINLRIRSGQTVALVGHTGAGKSTLADLVCRFYDPQEGSISIDSLDLRKMRSRSLLDRIAIVPQEPFLFNDTIRANILYGRPDAGQGNVEEAARAAAVHDEIAAMPGGYDTVVGERGTNLSGGQRQRVSIARALLRNAPILVLDEATSSLDSESEKLVQSAVDRLLEGRTTLVIAHRLSTIRSADLIVVLVEGRVGATGTHDELLTKSETYHRLWELQQAGGPAASESE